MIAALLCIASHARASQTDGDAVTLFRDEIVDAPMRIHWRESSLGDETRFAVAASGLSWRPEWNGVPLISQKGKQLSYADGITRMAAFTEARRDRANKIAFAFALSLVLHPVEENPTGSKTAFDYLRGYGADFDKALVGVVAAPDKLPLLYEYRYAAADVLVSRASARLMPIFLGLASADDRYLRSRGIVGLGMVGYRAEVRVEAGIRGLVLEPKELGISAVQGGMIDEAVRKAAEDRDYRVRAAAALALGLTGDDDSHALLKKLVKDRAYFLAPSADKRMVGLVFPVRSQAARSLERWGVRVNDDSGDYDARAVAKAIHGGQNVSNEVKDAKKKIEHMVRFNESEW